MSRGRFAAFACAVVIAVVSAGCSTVDHPGRLDRTPSPTGVTRIDPPSTPAPTATPTSPSTSASGLFTTPPGGKLSLKTPIKLGDKLGPNLPFAGPPPTGPPTAESALIFVRAFLATKMLGFYEADGSVLATYMTPGCDCRRILSDFNTMQAKHQHMEGPSAVIERIHINDMPDGGADVGVSVSYGRNQYVDSKGVAVKTEQAVTNVPSTFALTYDANHHTWMVVHVFG